MSSRLCSESEANASDSEQSLLFRKKWKDVFTYTYILTCESWTGFIITVQKSSSIPTGNTIQYSWIFEQYNVVKYSTNGIFI